MLKEHGSWLRLGQNSNDIRVQAYLLVVKTITTIAHKRDTRGPRQGKLDVTLNIDTTNTPKKLCEIANERRKFSLMAVSGSRL